MPESRENRDALSRIVPGYTQIFLYNGTDKVGRAGRRMRREARGCGSW